MGFEALSRYDENGDGIIDEQDKVYSKLLIWQDKNSNGISEKEELKTLKDMGIRSISLTVKDVEGVNTSVLYYEDGTSGKVGEFSFDSSFIIQKKKKTPNCQKKSKNCRISMQSEMLPPCIH